LEELFRGARFCGERKKRKAATVGGLFSMKKDPPWRTTSTDQKKEKILKKGLIFLLGYDIILLLIAVSICLAFTGFLCSTPQKFMICGFF
jgi:hypothetical protein